MIEQSILSNKLKSFDYYFNKLPLYLKNSYGFKEQFHLWWELLQEETNDADTLLNMLLIFDDNYLNYLYENNLATQNECDILDKLGSLFGVTRNFKVHYIDSNLQPVDKELHLTTEEFLILIKGQIIKNYCEGTRKQIEEYYNSVGIKIYIHTDSTSQATANVYLAKSVGDTIYDYSENIKDMFLSGQLLIEQVGIQYRMGELDFNRILFWDGTNKWAVIYYAEQPGYIESISPSTIRKYKVILNGLTTIYEYHFDELADGLEVGQQIAVGDPLGSNGGIWIA